MTINTFHVSVHELDAKEAKRTRLISPYPLDRIAAGIWPGMPLTRPDIAIQDHADEWSSVFLSWNG